MNRDQKWIVTKFLESLTDIKLRESESAHKIDYRLQLAEMVTTELPGDDIEDLAHRADAEAASAKMPADRGYANLGKPSRGPATGCGGFRQTG
jgi:hypothetical protein